MERFVVVAAALACCGCSEFAKGPMDARAGILAETKVAVGDSVAYGDTVDTYVFNDDELMRMDTYQRTVFRDDKLDVASTAGPKVVVMIVNGRTGRYSWGESNTYNNIRRLDAEFGKERKEHPTMSGECKMKGKSNAPFEIGLQPIMAKVMLRSIRCDFTGRAYEGEKLMDAKAYLTNVSSLCKMMDFGEFKTREIINAGRLVESDMKRMAEPDMVMQQLPGEIGKVGIDLFQEFYCYPNTNEEDTQTTPFTRLVIEGKIEGKTWYYPININREDICWVDGTPGIERNTMYMIDVTILRTGSTDPDKPVSSQQVSVACNVVPWKEFENRDEVF